MNGSSNYDHGKEKHQKMIELAAFILCLALTVQGKLVGVWEREVDDF